jgi:tetratricopeptide (TPR) repeat protein
MNYSRIAYQLGLLKISLFLYNKLLKIDDKSGRYWALYGNTCLMLDLENKAMNAYEKGKSLSKSDESWILGNIGNLYKNVGLYDISIKQFEAALDLDNESLYAHERLANSIKLRDEENKKEQELIKEGRVELRETTFEPTID